MQAQDVVEEALENKTDNPDLAAVYYHVASDNLADADMLIKQVEACIAKAQKAGDEEYDSMDLLWEADHKRIIKNIAKVKVCMDMYR